MYKITNKNGATLCFQVAADESDAVNTAKLYGHKGAKNAEFVRKA